MLSNFVKGDTIQLEITTNTNITGWKIRCEIYDKSGNSIQLATANSGGSDEQIEITDVTNGIFVITVAKDLSDNFDNNAFIEIEREDSDETVLTIYQDDFKFIDEKISWTSPS